MSWTLCTSGSAILKAGPYANATLIAYGGVYKTFLDLMSDEAESEACSLARYDVVTNFGSLTTNGKQIFQKFCSALVAQKIVAYDPSAIGTGISTLMLNVLENDVVNAKNLIIEDKNKTYLAIT